MEQNYAPGIGQYIALSYITGLVQDCNNSTAKALELLQSCTQPMTYYATFPWTPCTAIYQEYTVVPWSMILHMYLKYSQVK